MAALSISINAGNDGMRFSDFTVGTAAPTGGVDFEFRFNQTDQNSHNITVKEIKIALKAFILAIETGAIMNNTSTNHIPPPFSGSGNAPIGPP